MSKVIQHLRGRDGLKWVVYYFLNRFPYTTLTIDKLYLKLQYRLMLGRKLDLKHPVRFNEKIQWLKLYDRRPIYTNMVDKYAVKKYVADRIGEEYIIPTLGVWEKPEDIDWDSLPNQFVLKCTHDSGGLVICKDKNILDKESAVKKLSHSLKTNYYLEGREWPYKNVPHRIIAEKYMEDKIAGELPDYKFFCFDGKVKALFIATARQVRKEPYFDFFDEDFNHLDLRHGHENAPIPPKKPYGFETMISLAEKLSNGYPELRVDFYEVNGKVYFGELTLFHHNGTIAFDPDKWDFVFGEWFQLPEKYK